MKAIKNFTQFLQNLSKKNTEFSGFLDKINRFMTSLQNLQSLRGGGGASPLDPPQGSALDLLLTVPPRYQDKILRTKPPGQNPPWDKILQGQNPPGQNPPSIFYILLKVIYFINRSKDRVLSRYNLSWDMLGKQIRLTFRRHVYYWQTSSGWSTPRSTISYYSLEHVWTNPPRTSSNQQCRGRLAS